MIVRVTCIAMVVALLPGRSEAQLIEPPFDPQIHWAYSGFLGTGWYKISDERDGFVFRLTPRWRIGESIVDERRKIEYTFRLPVTIGVTRLDFGDIGGSLDPGNLANMSVNFGVDANIPVSDTLFVRPLAQVGYGTVLDEDKSAVTYSAEVRARKEFPRPNFDWTIMASLGFAGYTPNEGRSDEFTFASLAVEFSYPIAWKLSPSSQTLFHWHVAYTDFIDDVEFDFRRNDVESIGNYWQIGAAIGLRDEQVRIWALSFDRLGLAYNYSRTGELRGIKIQFRSLYDF